jgi:hypothetical protein
MKKVTPYSGVTCSQFDILKIHISEIKNPNLSQARHDGRSMAKLYHSLTSGFDTFGRCYQLLHDYYHPFYSADLDEAFFVMFYNIRKKGSE